MISFFNMTVYATMKVSPADGAPYETGDRQECRIAWVADGQHVDRDLKFKVGDGGMARVEFHEHPSERSCLAYMNEFPVQSSEMVVLAANPSQT